MDHQERRHTDRESATAEEAATEQLARTLIYVADAAEYYPEKLIAEMDNEVLARLYCSIFAGISSRGLSFGTYN
ncbi:hypothetical protein [Streptomyces sp. NPDC060005]|uniref:hypothetical protein n=1 Tax=unclassified Streptomyces TaxID=2593676 RepID=UPI0036AAB213